MKPSLCLATWTRAVTWAEPVKALVLTGQPSRGWLSLLSQMAPWAAGLSPPPHLATLRPRQVLHMFPALGPSGHPAVEETQGTWS